MSGFHAYYCTTAKFRDFERFVSAKTCPLNPDDDVQIDDYGELGKATLTASAFRRAFCLTNKTGGAISRNNQVRSALVNAVMEECGVKDFLDLPPKVRKAFQGRSAHDVDSDWQLVTEYDDSPIKGITSKEKTKAIKFLLSRNIRVGCRVLTLRSAKRKIYGVSSGRPLSVHRIRKIVEAVKAEKKAVKAEKKAAKPKPKTKGKKA